MLDDYLIGSVGQLSERARHLLAAISKQYPPEFRALAQTCRNQVNELIAEFDSLINDARYQKPELKALRLRAYTDLVNRLDFIEPREEITVDYRPGEVELVTQHDGSVLKLRKLAADYDPTDRISAISHLQLHQARGEIVTGLLYVDPDAEDLHDHLATVQKPLSQLSDAGLIPGSAALAGINDSLR